MWDNVKLTKTTSDQTFTKNGRTYRLQLWGFVPADNPRTLITPENIQSIPTAQCPQTPAADAKRTDTFITQELSVNYGCLYGVITEERTVRIAKSVEDPDHANPTIPAASFGVTTGATWRDNTNRNPMTTGNVSVTKPMASSAPVKSWYISSTDSATLTPTGFGETNAKYDSHFIPFEVTNSDFIISEDQIGDPQWKLKDIKCFNGIGEDVAVTKTERGVNFKNVGGEGTHTVLTGHSGLGSATMFDHLNRVELGDVFYIEVLGRHLKYKVTDIRTVLPNETETLNKVAGKDLATLITCTPYGINTHRLLVTGERVPMDDAQVAEESANVEPAVVQTWMIAVVVGIIIVLITTAVLWFLAHKNRKKREAAQLAAAESGARAADGTQAADE